jgi:hypothetical protein
MAAEIVLKQRPPAHIKTASLADILGFNPKRGESRAPFVEETIPDEEIARYLLLSKDEAAELTGRSQERFNAALLQFENASVLSDWQQELRNELAKRSPLGRQVRCRVLRDSEVGSSIQEVGGHRRLEDPIGGGLAFA